MHPDNTMSHVEYFDWTKWPILIARMPGFAQFSMDAWITGFDRAIDRGVPFVVVIDLEGFLKDPREDATEKRKATAWLKMRRDAYSRLCRGNVYVVADDTLREQVLAETSTQGRKLGFAFRAASDEPGALAVAETLLADGQSGAAGR